MSTVNPTPPPATIVPQGTTLIAEAQRAVIPGVRILLYGDPGTGKTYSLRYLHEIGVTPFIIFTDPHGRQVLGNVPCPKIHWMYIPPTTGGFAAATQRVKMMTELSWSVLSQMTADPDKAKYTSFYRLYLALGNFTCDRCGEKFGDVSTWKTDRVIVIDGLSGLNEMAMQLSTGMSIAKSQPQWGAAQQAELGLINQLCYDTMAHFILIAHPDKKVDEVHGGMIIAPAPLGKAITQDVPKNFSDVVWAVRNGDKFHWSTVMPNCMSKAINFPLKDKIDSNFSIAITKWKADGGVIVPTQKTA